MEMKMRKYLYVFITAIGFRIFLYLIGAMIMAFRVKEGSFTWEVFLNNWCRWDANHYLNIARNGYRGAVEVCETCRDALLAKGVSREVMENGQHLFLVFFPLFPWVMKVFGLLVADLRLAGLLVSTLAYGIGCIYLYRLVEIDYDEETAENCVVLTSLFPFGFFFGGIMSESLFLMISAAALYYICVHKWWKAILFGALGSLCRMQGALLIIPAGLELLCMYQPWKMIRTKDFMKCKEMIARGLSLLGMLAGTGIYLLINWRVDGYPFSFMVYQNSHWHQGMGLPTDTLAYVFRNAYSTDYDLQMRMALWIPQAVLAVFSVAVLAVGVKKIRVSYIGCTFFYILLTYSATWLLSAGRYLSCCVPLFVILAVLTRKRKWLQQALTLVFAALQVIYLNGYLSGMQIM